MSTLYRRTTKKDKIPLRARRYTTIEGTDTNQPYKYCCRYKAYLTAEQVVKHHCKRKECNFIKPFEWADKRGK